MAADVLSASQTIAQAVAEGGWSTKPEEPESDEEDNKANNLSDGDEQDENKIFQTILVSISKLRIRWKDLNWNILTI